MAGDEELGRVGQQFGFGRGGILARVAAYMHHEDIDPLTGKAELLGVFAADISAVYVAIYAT